MKNLLCNERGSVIILFALFLVSAIGMAALAIDLGYYFQEKTHLQNTADAAALAGVQDLTDTNQATTTVHTYIQNNGYTPAYANSITPAYSKDNSKITVTLTKDIPTFFMKVFHINTLSATVVASAEQTVTTKTTGAGNFSIYSKTGAMTFAQGNRYDGNVYSGGALTIGGGTQFTKSIYTPSTLNINGWGGQIAGSVYTGSSMNVSGGATINGNTYVDGSASIKDMTTPGNIYANGPVSLLTSPISGTVYSTSNVSFPSWDNRYSYQSNVAQDSIAVMNAEKITDSAPMPDYSTEVTSLKTAIENLRTTAIAKGNVYNGDLVINGWTSANEWLKKGTIYVTGNLTLTNIGGVDASGAFIAGGNISVNSDASIDKVAGDSGVSFASINGSVTIAGSLSTSVNGAIYANNNINVPGFIRTLTGSNNIALTSVNGDIVQPKGGITYNGVVYAPKGTFSNTSGSGGNTYNGGVVAYHIEDNSGGNIYTASGSGSGSGSSTTVTTKTYRLVE